MRRDDDEVRLLLLYACRCLLLLLASGSALTKPRRGQNLSSRVKAH